MIEKHSTDLKRKDLSSDPRLDFIVERMREYLCTKWTRDDWAMKITIYRDKNLPPTPEEIRASFDSIRVTSKNAAILATILVLREQDKRYDIVRYMQENWKRKGKKDFSTIE